MISYHMYRTIHTTLSTLDVYYDRRTTFWSYIYHYVQRTYTSYYYLLAIWIHQYALERTTDLCKKDDKSPES